MRKLVNKLVKPFLEYRYRKIEEFMYDPHIAQERVFTDLIQKASATEFGIQHDFKSIKIQQQFASRVPLQDYDSIKAWIKRMMHGEEDVLWPGKISWFAKSSGTTSDKSKFIPVSKENLKGCHIKGSWDAMAMLYHLLPDAQVFAEKNLVLGGSLHDYPEFPDTRYGDVSAIMLHNMPIVGRPFITPDFETALMNDWEQKITRMAEIVKDVNLTTFGGVPTWTIVLFDRILEITGKSNMLEVWPDAKVYMHGGVGFDPYREQFKEYFPSDDFKYLEVYNASEGFFSVQPEFGATDMALLLDNGIYYEFIPKLNGEIADYAVPLEDVEEGKSYAIVISTNAGLWRYQPGDVVRFTSVMPYRIQIVGRTQQYINAFGEEVMVNNTDKALTIACSKYNARVKEYTVAPRFLSSGNKGGHEWVIEFDKEPDELDVFRQELDLQLQKANSDYEAKRSYDLALECLILHKVNSGTFHEWMKSRGKLGGQNKVPRLCNERKYVEEILHFSKI
jgi:hypothetical protein